MTLTERISILLQKTIKEEKKMTQVELAHRVGIAPASVNKWMNGGAPSVDKLPLLCQILEISPNELFGYKQEAFPQEAIDLYTAFLKYPEYKKTISKLLNVVLNDIDGDSN